MIIRVKEKKWSGFEYRLTGNAIYVNADRIVYAEYHPKDDMSIIHVSTSREVISCAGDIGDSLELPKEREPRVLTLEEIKEGEPYWLGAGKEFVTRPVICVHREDDAQKPYIMFVLKFGTFSWLSEDYGKTWRVWSAKPDEKMRKAVSWNE